MGVFSHEADLFLIRPSGYGFEIEIKRSKSDMVKDFKKKMNHIDKKNRIAQLFYAFPIDLLPKVESLVPVDCGIIVVSKKKLISGEYYETAKIHRDAKRRKGVKKLTVKEQLKIARLGTMRIFGLKAKIIELSK